MPADAVPPNPASVFRARPAPPRPTTPTALTAPMQGGPRVSHASPGTSAPTPALAPDGAARDGGPPPPYRARLALAPSEDVLTVVRREVAAWTAELVPPFDGVPLGDQAPALLARPGHHRLDRHGARPVGLAVILADPPLRDATRPDVTGSGASFARAVRYRLSEEGGTTTTVTLTVGHDQSGTIDVLAEHPSAPVRRPGLVDRLVHRLPVHDGGWPSTTFAQRVGVEEVGSLVAALTAPSRRTPLFLVALPSRHTSRDASPSLATGTAADAGTHAPLDRRADTWMRVLVGTGQIVVLDLDATARFNAEVGEDHRLPPGSLRAYVEGALPRLGADAGRHQVFDTARLATTSDATVAALLYRIATGRSSLSAPPRRDRRSLAVDGAVERALSDAESTLLIDGLVGTRERPGPVARTRHDTAAAAESDPAGLLLRRQLDERQRTIEALTEAVEFERLTSEEALAECRAAHEDLARAWSEVTWLRERLAAADDAEAAYGAVPLSAVHDVPRCFGDLLDRLRGLDLVEFTGDERIAVGLDANDTTGTMVAVAWECLLSVDDYARAKSTGAHQGNLKTYLLDPPRGFRAVPLGKFGERESAITMDQWGEDRRFPVPRDVDSTGASLMETHFKLPRCGMLSPRLHLLDDTRRSGKVYVGYLGPHLRNTQTN